MYTYGHTLSLHDALPISGEHRLAVDPGLYASPRQTGHIRCCGDRLLVEKLLTIPRNGFSERMIAEPLDGYGNRHEFVVIDTRRRHRSEEHTSELQSLMRSSYAVFCFKKKKK